MDVCRHVRPLLRPHEPPLPSANCTSATLPCHIFPCPGVTRSRPPRGETCHILVIVGGGYYPLPVPLTFPARGGARSGPRGRSNLWPSLGNMTLYTPHIFPAEVNKSYIYRVFPGGGGVLIRSPFPTQC